jgi:uncharacterized membrane protein YidH (DUF202 family)
MDPESVMALIFSFLIIGGVIIVYSGMRHRTKVLEMAHRERLAMIERGMTPTGDLDGTPQQVVKAQRTARSNRLLSMGIVIVGLGLALATLIAFASREPELAIGIGGAVAVLGGSLIVTALLVHGRQADDTFRADSYVTRDRNPPPTDRSV